ncbi:MAG: zinc-binding alcohol dehydrogenase family protein [Actinobacteria bacterium]|jgi:NADPH2:quinone reductase|nr:zinc-binding alcohol dehydrogenase family protein [Actinomycetota bacterium]
MKAAILHDYGTVPIVSTVEEPTAGIGEALVQVDYAALNPVDLRIASGKFYAGAHDLPYVVGSEGVGRVVDSRKWASGTEVYFASGRPGAICERVAVEDNSLVPIPSGLDKTTAAGLGVPGIAAYLGLVDKGGMKQGERVVVLGATGAVGWIGAQLARVLGAGRIVAVGRNRAALERIVGSGNAHAYVVLHGQSVDDLAREIEDAVEGKTDLIIDPLWGEPALAAMKTLATGGRLINIGESAGAALEIPSALVRSKNMQIIGHTNFAISWTRQQEVLRTLFDYAVAGELSIEHRVFSMEEIADAWHLQADSPGSKLLLACS